jgi:hypothetical protein
MIRPKREDYKTDIEFRIALMQWRQWVIQQRDEP